MRRVRFAVVATLCAAALVGAARAEQVDGFDRMDLSELKNPDPSSWPGRKVFVDAKWLVLHGKEVKLDKVPNDRIFILDDPGDALVNALSADKTPRPDRQPLEKKKSNVRLFGRTAIEQGLCVLFLERIVKLPDDQVEFQTRLDELEKRPEAQQNPEDYYRIGRDAKARAEAYGLTELQAFERRANQAGIALEMKRRKKGDARGSIALAKKSIALTGSAEDAIKLLGEVALDSSTAAADKDEAQKLLRENNAYYWRGEYVSYSRFKSSIGFVGRGGKWVRRERAELEDAIAEELRNPNPVRVGLNYEEFVQKGKVVRGMKKDEVVRTKGYGFPSFVDRKRMTRPKTNDTVNWDQWVYENGARVYFLNGECCLEKPLVNGKPTPWPEQ